MLCYVMLYVQCLAGFDFVISLWAGHCSFSTKVSRSSYANACDGWLAYNVTVLDNTPLPHTRAFPSTGKTFSLLLPPSFSLLSDVVDVLQNPYAFFSLHLSKVFVHVRELLSHCIMRKVSA